MHLWIIKSEKKLKTLSVFFQLLSLWQIEIMFAYNFSGTVVSPRTNRPSTYRAKLTDKFLLLPIVYCISHQSFSMCRLSVYPHFYFTRNELFTRRHDLLQNITFQPLSFQQGFKYLIHLIQIGFSNSTKTNFI